MAEPSLSERMREAAAAGEAAVRRAQAEKAGVARHAEVRAPAEPLPPVPSTLPGPAASVSPALPPSPVLAPSPAPAVPPAPATPRHATALEDEEEPDLRLADDEPVPGNVLAEGTLRERVKWLLGRGGVPHEEGPATPLPPLEPGDEEVELYAVDPPFAFIRVVRAARTGGDLEYRVIEPPLTATQRHVLAFVKDALVRGLQVDPHGLEAPERERFVREGVDRILQDYRIRAGPVTRQRLHYYLRRDFLGLGVIHPLMRDPDLEDISCDGAEQPIFVHHRRYETIPTDVRFHDDPEVDAFVIRLAQRSGKAISISDPILDAALPDGSRLQATLGHEVTQNGSTFTIRKFRPDPFTPVDLVRLGTMSAELLAWFWLVVEHGLSLIFSGGTASGKTTALNAISQFIPRHAKVVSIEDTREVNLRHANWIKAVTRSGAGGEGTGEIGMFELLKAALRQRPDYILVGEVRGVEATVAFQAMATGHTVYSTMHADSARSVVYRLENDPINVPRLVLQALDIIAIQAQVRIGGKRVRRVREVVELVGMDPVTKELLTNTVFRWDLTTDTFRFGGRSYVLERIARERSWTGERVYQELARRRAFLEALLEKGITTGDAIGAEARAYESDPEGTLRRLGARA